MQDESEGLDREFLAAQARYSDLLRLVPEAPATFEKLAWIALWSRLYGVLVGARGSVQQQSRIALAVLDRTAFETELHIEAIVRPSLGIVLTDRDSPASDNWERVRERLFGFVAWTLLGDQSLYERAGEDETLRAAFDPLPAREHERETGSVRTAFGEVEVLSDQEASLDLSRAKKALAAKASRAERWLTAAQLQPWIKRARDVEGSASGRRRPPISLFELFGEGSSVFNFLNRDPQWASMTYLQYAEGSAFIHGSHLSGSLLMLGDAVFADVGNPTGEIERHAQSVLSTCLLQAQSLEGLANALIRPRTV